MIRYCIITLAVCLICAHSSSGQDELEPPPEPQFDPCRAVVGGSIFKPLDEIRTVLKNDGKRLPADCSVTHFTSQMSGSEPRFYQDTEFHWQPTNFFHMPVYFDDVPLERYGQSKFPHLQPIISGGKFILQMPALPYKMGIDHPHDCITTLGHRPPGDCVPCIRQRLPKELDASFVQGAAAVGLVFLLP